MKTFSSLILSLTLLGSSGQLMAASAIQEAASNCQAAAALHFSTSDDLRVKFRGASGPRKAKTVRLRVIPEDGESFNALCRINTTTQQIQSLTRS